MQGRLTPVLSLGEAELEAWQGLADRAVEPNPMNGPDFVVAAARNQRSGSGISLVLAEDRGRMVGAFPVRFTGQHGNVRWPMATTNVRRMTYLGTPLVAPEGGQEAISAMLAALARQRRGGSLGGFRVLVVQWLGEGGPVAGWLRSAAAALGYPVTVYEEFEQPYLARRSQGDYASLLTSKHRKDYSRRARRLAEHLGAELEVVNRAGDPGAVDDFIELEAAGYKREIQVAMATQPGEPEYFREMCQRLARRGRLHHLELRAGGRLIATQLSVEEGGLLFLIKVGHDDEFARYDPGVQLHLRAMEYFHHQTGASAIRVCTFAGNELLLRLYPQRAATSTLMIGLGGRVDNALVRSLPAARRLRQRVRRGAASVGRDSIGGSTRHESGNQGGSTSKSRSTNQGRPTDQGRPSSHRHDPARHRSTAPPSVGAP